MKRRIFILSALLLAALPLPNLSGADNILSLGSRRDLFVDDTLIGQLNGSRLQLHAPVPAEQVMTFELPWEGVYSGYCTLIVADGKYRMYYRGLPVASHTLDTEVTCLAESQDGIRWTKPKLGLFEVKGTRENNVILARHRACHNFAPFLDTNPQAPTAQRYKALGGTGEPGLIALVSADGLRWEELRKEPVITKGAFDSQNVAFWSESENCYVCYFRVFINGVRWVARTTSHDFLNWTEPVSLDFGGRPPEHHYTNQLLPYHRAPHIYLGLPTRFLPGRRALTDEQMEAIATPQAWNYRDDCTDILLTSTRGGTDYHRFAEAFIRPGLDPHNWTSRANYSVYGMVQRSPTELSFYVNHHLGYPSSHVRRYTLRVDGFVSVTAPMTGGEVITQPFTFAGQRLTLNYATSAAGSVRVEIQDPQGQAIPGRALADCPEIIGDQIERTVNWKGTSDVSALAGQPIRLRFLLKDADLYSIRFAP